MEVHVHQCDDCGKIFKCSTPDTHLGLHNQLRLRTLCFECHLELFVEALLEDLCKCGHDVEDHNDVWKKSTACSQCKCKAWNTQ